MNISRKLKINNYDNDMAEVLNEAAKMAEKARLNEKQAMRLRLLAEETVGMVNAITEEFQGSLIIMEDKLKFTLHLEAETDMNLRKREELLSASRTGKNEAAKGFMGKVRDIFEMCLMMPDDPDKIDPTWYDALAYNSIDPMFMGTVSPLTDFWSLSAYREGVMNDKDENEAAAEAWDELEKSIVANLADDVRIGIEEGHVVMDIEKQFHNM